MRHVLGILSELQIAHWLIISGGVIVTLGAVGLVIRRIRIPKSEEPSREP